MSFHLKNPLLASVLLAVGAMPSMVRAVEIGDKVALHGYGYQAYVQTEGNRYLGASNDGGWDQLSANLIATATLDSKSKLWMMIDSDSDGTRLGWAFADYQVNNNLVLRGGQIKLPWGVYNETLDARILQQSAIPPSIYADVADMRDETYRGIGANYSAGLGQGRLVADGYFGQSTSLVTSNSSNGDVDRRLIGGRFVYETPVEGLRFLLSGFQNSVEKGTGGVAHEESWVFSADYVNNDWDIKSEYARKNAEAHEEGYYLQVGHVFADRWTPYARYDHMVLDTQQRSNPAFNQTDYVAGLDFKINANLSVRAENHFNHGYGLPVASGEAVAGQGKTRWDMVAASINFMF